MSSIVLQKPERTTPYIVMLGSIYHIVIDGEPFIEAQSSYEAIISLMAAYFVFNIRYSDHVLPSLLFLQHQILGQSDETTKTCRNLSIFLNMLNA